MAASASRTRSPATGRRGARTLAALGCLALVATACTGDGDDGPEAVVDRLTERLSEHTLTQVPLLDTSDADTFADLVAPLSDVPVEVEAGEVTESDDGTSAQAGLTWAWRLGDEGGEQQTWTYETTVDLVGSEQGWSVDWQPSSLEASLTDGDRLGLFTVRGARGAITGQGGQPIVVDRPVQRYGVDKTRIVPAQVAPSARQVARALDIEVAPYVAEARAAGDAAFVEALVLRPGDARERVAGGYGEIPGAVVIADEIPLAPSAGFAAPLLGRVGPATAELVEQSEGRVEAGDETGLSGLQLRYDEQLAPVDGVEVVAARGEGADEERRTLTRVAAVDGTDLATTIDVEAQTEAEAALAEVGPASAIVAVRPSDGQVLASASGPGGGGLDTADQGRFAPGSTFKVVTSLALLRAGSQPDDTLACPATTDVDGRTFGNYSDYPAGGLGQITLRTALANSCNTAFIGARDRLDDGALADAAATLGLGEDADVGFPAYFGEVPEPDGQTDEAASMIGQGRVQASPLAMATVAASVAAGETVVPTLLPDVEAQASESSGPPEPSEPLTDAEARTLQGLMRGVVTDGSASFLADVPGEVGAKTGTAEYGEPDASGELATHAWMIATRGDLAVAVFVADGASGSATAGPILERFLRAGP